LIVGRLRMPETIDHGDASRPIPLNR
jgi:hypothetical protein